MNENEYVTCPFCGEGGFELIGLKIHLDMGHCEEFNNIDVMERLKPLNLKEIIS
jgi:hypothetical protein